MNGYEQIGSSDNPDAVYDPIGNTLTLTFDLGFCDLCVDQTYWTYTFDMNNPGTKVAAFCQPAPIYISVNSYILKTIPPNPELTLSEYHIYGSEGHGRFSTWRPAPLFASSILDTNAIYGKDSVYYYREKEQISRKIGEKDYEVKDHLGNVRMTCTDQKIPVDVTDLTLGWELSLNSVSNYYPFGMQQPGMSWTKNSSGYRYGFNSQEQDDEVYGAGNSIAFESRIHDPRLGRLFSVDPLLSQFSFQSSYIFASNNPILFIDDKGEKTQYYVIDLSDNNPKLKLYKEEDPWLSFGDVVSVEVIGIDQLLSYTFTPFGRGDISGPCPGCGDGNYIGNFEKFKENPVNSILSGNYVNDQKIITDMVNDALLALLMGKAMSIKAPKQKGLKGAKFAQTKIRKNEEFSPEGQAKYSKLAGRKVSKVDELAKEIKSGNINPKDVSVDYVMMNGEKVILNTRTSTALKRADVPMDIGLVSIVRDNRFLA